MLKLIFVLGHLGAGWDDGISSSEDVCDLLTGDLIGEMAVRSGSDISASTVASWESLVVAIVLSSDKNFFSLC